MVIAELMTLKHLGIAVKGLERALRSVRKPANGKTLVDAIKKLVHPRSPSLHLLCCERPLQNIKIVTVKSFEDIIPMIQEIRKSHKDDMDARLALQPHAPSGAIRKAADLINKYAPRMSLKLGGLHDVFWATTLSEFETLVGETRQPGAKLSLAERIRDRLGLASIEPTNRQEPRHLFAFIGQVPLAAIAEHIDFVAARPTMIEGFDNRRFRQRRSGSSAIPTGFGQTVDLNGGSFCDGGPELVVTGVEIGQYFQCQWLGEIRTPTAGTDEDFVKFLLGGRSLDELQRILEEYCCQPYRSFP